MSNTDAALILFTIIVYLFIGILWGMELIRSIRNEKQLRKASQLIEFYKNMGKK